MHALAHPLYRMGAPLTLSHVERLMLLFGVWEGRNGARSAASNQLACRLAAAVTPDYLEKLAERHGLEPAHRGRIGLSGGSDDHGALDVATTWTEANGVTVEAFLASVTAGEGSPLGEHGSTVKLAHAVGALALNALPPGRSAAAAVSRRDSGAALRRPRRGRGPPRADHRHGLRDREPSPNAPAAGGIGLDALPTAGPRVASLLLAGALEAPYLASMRHHTGSRSEIEELEAAFFGIGRPTAEPRALVFTDTFAETNGVAGTMRRLAELPQRASSRSRSSRPVSGTRRG